MPRWTGTWLSGPEVTLGELRRGPDDWVGKRLGLPRDGEGSVATLSTRAFAFVVDIVASAMVAGLVVAFVQDPTPAQRQGAALAVLAVEHVLLVGLTGQTLGMRLLGLQVLRLPDPSRPPGLLAAATRTLPLLMSLGLTGFFTSQGRGIHDQLARCVVVRA